MYIEALTSMKRRTKIMTQLKRTMYLAGDSHSNRDSEEFERAIAIELCKGTSLKS